jgi:prepilin-type N-terminal cleavage/methylation domain-containing protein
VLERRTRRPGDNARVHAEAGFTIVEMLVAMTMFAIISVGIYQVLFQTAAGSRTAQNVARTSQEARLGFNRMVRDSREAQDIKSPTATSFQIQTDFSGDGVIQPTPSDVTGDYEVLTFTFTQGAGGDGTITATSGGRTEVLMAGVDCVRKADNSCYDVFSYSSSRLEWDSNQNGVTTAAELDAAPSLGNSNGVLDASELDFVDGVSFQLRVTSQGETATIYAEAQLRNHR